MFLFKKKPFELHPLPMNIPEFEAWSARVIKKAQLPTSHVESLRFALAGMILHSDPHQFFRPDEYYIDLLRKAASDQVATQVISDMQAARRARIEAQEKQLSEATQNQSVADEEKAA